MMLVAGVDGCRAGWVVASARPAADGALQDLRIEIVPTFADIIDRACDRVVVDIPVGLADGPEPRPRRCDSHARRLLAPIRSSSVFTAPPRAAFDLLGWDDPRRPAMAITLQGFGILPKIREVDARMRPDLQDPRRAPCVLESHPELIFRDLNGGTPVVARKRSRQGRADRLELLERAFGMAIEVPRLTPGAAADDTLDALACLWVAMAPADDLQPIPAEPEHDSRGLHMAMWRRTVTPGIAPHRETLRLGYVEVDSGALIVGDPLYVLPQADAGRAGVDYAEVAATPDKPALYLAGRPVLLLQQFGGDGTYPVIGEFERGRLVRVRIDLDVEPEE